MPRGPLPQQRRRRTNSPTIPTTVLPPGGRIDPTPKVPSWVTLEGTGQAWWEWVWHTPQAAAWADGMEATVARRARIEDLLLEVPADKASALLGQALQLDRQLGLTPRAMADLRWTISAEEEPSAELVAVPSARWAKVSA